MQYTLITGASSGIGEQFAWQYAEKGHHLILVARSEDQLNNIAEQIRLMHHVTVHVIAQDLAVLNAASELFEKCRTRGLEVNFLINDAGIGLIGAFEEHELPKIEEMLILNTITLTKLVYLFLPELKKNDGFILNVASQVAFEPTPYMAAYGATKAYVLNFTEALRVELEDTNITVMALCPGPTYTKFFQRTNSTPDQIRFKFRTPEDVVTMAIDGIENNKAITIPGWENGLMTFVNRFMPRHTLAKFSSYMVKR